MSRILMEWIGKTDDSEIPVRVRVRVFTKADECCTICGRKLRAGEVWTCEHVVALINWRATAEQPHGNRESNLSVTCRNCLPDKNAADVSEKSAVYQKRAAHVLPKAPKTGFGGFRKLPPHLKKDFRTGRITER